MRRGSGDPEAFEKVTALSLPPPPDPYETMRSASGEYSRPATSELCAFQGSLVGVQPPAAADLYRTSLPSVIPTTRALPSLDSAIDLAGTGGLIVPLAETGLSP